MNQCRKQVETLLIVAIAPVKLLDEFPHCGAAFPVATMTETGNNTYASTEKGEYLTEHTFSIDVYAKTKAEVADIAGKINAAFASIGFRRTFMYDVPNQTQKHITMRFRGLTDPRNFVYQS